MTKKAFGILIFLLVLLGCSTEEGVDTKQIEGKLAAIEVKSPWVKASGNPKRITSISVTITSTTPNLYGEAWSEGRWADRLIDAGSLPLTIDGYIIDYVLIKRESGVIEERIPIR
jgi:hypothetical protein